MIRSYPSLGIGLLVALLLAPAATAESTVRFLTGPQTGEPLEIATSYLHQQRAELGLTENDLSEIEITDQYASKNGITHIFFVQKQNGIPVYNGQIGIHVARDGSIVHLTNGFVSDLAAKITTSSARLDAESAISRVADHLGMGEVFRQPRKMEGSDRKALYDGAGISRKDIPVKQTYVPVADGVRLAWSVVVDQIGSADWPNVLVDAETGAVLGSHNYTSYESGGGVPQDSYLVFPLPQHVESGGGPTVRGVGPGEHPNNTAQLTVTGPADPIASPNGWHDSDGTPGNEFTDTRGRNVHAYEDTDADNNPDNSWVPGVGNPLDFDYPFDPAQGPTGGTNQEAAIVNLFYWNNVMHDLTYQYGFDVAAGNFEGNDFVLAEAQDGSGTNNANFSTLPDGINGRMQMFVWTAPPAFVVNSPVAIADTYDAGGASFGAALSGQTGDLKLADDGDDEGGTASTTDACQALPAGSMNGLIALIDRGACEFGVKVLNAENAGAIGAVVVNNAGDGTTTMGPGAVGGQVTIPAMFVGQGTGDLLKANLPAPGVNVTFDGASAPDRDSDLDAGVIAHEYGHGISIRLTGGPSNSGCLQGSEQAGEGWSDFWTLVLYADENDTREDTRGVGNYLTFQDNDGSGIRNFPYSTDMEVNPQTYADIDGTNVPHGVGEIWAGMLWEMYWNLVDKHGYDADLYNGTGGNNMTIQLMMDGLKLQGCAPTFVAARDAILLADQTNNAGDNQCEIWNAFAKRGVGLSAAAGTTDVGDETEAFDVPEECAFVAEIFEDDFESGDILSWSSNFP